MFGEQKNEQGHEIYVEGIKLANMLKLQEAIMYASGKTRGRDVRQVANRGERDCVSLPLFADKEGRILLRDAKVEGITSELRAGSLVAAFPFVEMGDRGEVKETEGCVLTFIDKDSSSRNEVNSERDNVLQDSLFTFNVESSKSLADLFAAIDLFEGKIYLSGKREVTKEYIKDVIIKVMEGKKGLEFITSRYSLKKKIEELLLKTKE